MSSTQIKKLDILNLNNLSCLKNITITINIHSIIWSYNISHLSISNLEIFN